MKWWLSERKQSNSEGITTATEGRNTGFSGGETEETVEDGSRNVKKEQSNVAKWLVTEIVHGDRYLMIK